MRCFKTCFTLFLVSIITSGSFAQPVNNAVKSVMMATPNAAALGKYGDIPVSLHTGVPNIGIPITSVQEGPLSLDISLGYHASGIKMAEPASWVGLGWTLNAGGVISRTIQGLKDEGPNGYYASTTPVPWPLTTAQQAQYATTYDGEPDIFSFNVGGYTGKFFINKDKTIHIVPKQDLKITISPAGTELFAQFRIVTPDGTKYYFGSAPGDGTTNTAREQSTVDDPATLATSSWYLRRIESQDGFYSITFNYVNEDYSFKSPASCEFKYVFCLPGGSTTQTSDCSSPNSIDPQHFYNRVLVKGKRLNTITAGVTTVTFVPSSTGRQDLEAYPPLTTPLPSALDKIKVEQTASYCTEFRFTYDYYTDASHNTIPEGKRLRLTELLEISCDGTVQKEPYKFTYYTSTLPWRLSHKVDHWGFNNGAASNESNTVNTPSTTVIAGGTTFVYGSSDRNSNETSMLEGVLTKIDYPTGGNTQFTYEANDYPTTQSYTYEDFLLQVSNCTYPHVCCGTQSNEMTRSFTAAELSGARYRFSLKRPACYGGVCTPATPVQAQLEIYQMPGNIPISTSTVLNITNSICEDTIGGLLSGLVTLQPNISYRFKVIGTNGKGDFQIFKYAQGSFAVNKKVGGLRVKTIRSSDGTNTANDIIKTYEYKSDIITTQSSGTLFYTPAYGYAFTYGGVQMAYFRDGAITPMGGFEDYHIGYSLVTELFNGNGKTKHTFYIEPMAGMAGLFPTPPEPARLQNGFETVGTTLDAGATVVATTSSGLYADTYTLPNGGTNNKVKAFRITTGCSGYDPIYVFSNPYAMRTRHVRPGTTTTTIDGITTTQTYNYESTKVYAPPIDVSLTNSDGKVTKTEYKYAWNLTGFVADSLKKRNMIGTPLETIVKVNNVQVDGSKVDFALFDKTTGARLTAGSTNANPYPWKFYRYEATFDANGIVVAGAAYDQQDEIISYYGSASAGKGYPQTWQKINWPSETYEWETGGRLKKRTYQSFVTEYTWNTGTRLLQKTKAVDGQEIWYDYDKLSRLSKVWSRPSTAGTKTSANVTTEYFYQYKNIPNPNNFVKAKSTFTPASGSSVNVQETFQYLDGLGRPVQTVGKQQSPGLKDVVMAVEYDKWGRQTKSYNPFETTGTTGAIAPSIPGGTPYTLNQYESSPLSRVTSVTPPSWYATTTAYETNIANEVKLDHAANTFYAAGSLLKTTVTEPGAGGAGTGNKIITYKDKKGRVILVKRTDNAGSQTAETYSQYDDKDRLKLVIPPGAAYNSMGLTFSYTYDGADNMLTKKVPDAATVTMKYNTRDQLTLEQDGNLFAQNKWRCIRYDDYGRPYRTGLFSGTVPNPIQPTLDPTDLYTENTYDGTLAIEKGKLKKARVRVFDTANTWLETNYTYDSYGRVNGTTGNNYLLPADLNAEAAGFIYDYADHVIIDTRVSKQSTSVSHTLIQTHLFDHWGRLTSNLHSTDFGPTVTISDLAYNWKNQLIEKNLGKTASGSYLQSLDYTYNDQGWLQAINNPTLGGTNVTLAGCSAPNPGAASSTPDNNDLFYLDLKYDVLQSGLSGTAQKNGNISQVIWRTRGRERQSYSLTYDYLDRLLTSTYADITDAGTPNSSNAYRENLTYDARGNILTLNRYGYTPSGACFAVNQIDNLTYTYNTGTNKLQKIADAAPAGTKMYGWHNVTGAISTAQYAYDANGNMNSDPYKGMNVTYNFLNLPSQMSFSSGTKTIDVLYDATGRKLRKTVTDGGVLQYRQEYVNGIEYRYTTAGGTVLEAVYHAEGRVYNNGGTLRYEYAIRDHLGNTRLTFTDKNGNGVVDVTNTSANEILQENHFYPFGLDMAGPWMNDAAQDNQYKYNGKELNGDFGLNWMDYGARWYDGALGRWWCVDLMLGKYMEWSPYNYAKDNPVIFIDPNGMFTSWNPGMQEMIDGSKKVQERGIGNMQNGNTIYVLGLNGADKSVIKGLKSILEKFINAANLTTNVVMVGDSKKFDITKIKTTDAVAVVGGNKKEAADFILGNLDKGYLSEEFKTGLKDKFLKTPSFDNPELSDRGPQNWGYVIATSTMNEEIFKYPNGKTVTGSVTGTYSFLNMTDAVSLCILHGMGHNSGIQHPTNEDLGFMSVGPKLAMIIALHKGNIVSLIESTARNNPEMMQQMSNRFNSNNDNQ